MRQTHALLIIAAVLAFSMPPVAYAQTFPSPSPSITPNARQALSDARFIGPLLAPSADTNARGHVFIEPFFYDVMQYGAYDQRGTVTPAQHVNGYGSFAYLSYGLTDRLTVSLIPVVGYTTANGGPNSSRLGFGDQGIAAEYRLLQYQQGHFTPTTSIVVEETFPTGRYDKLGTNPNNGFGSGVYSTLVALYTQSYAWMPNGRILRMRLDLSQTFSGGTPVEGTSVYGTSSGFHGWAKPGSTFTADASGEYSLTRNWALASDVLYGYTRSTMIGGPAGVTNLGDSHWVAIAPAVEYSWSPVAGALFAVRIIPSGRNTSATITPAIAISISP